MVKSSDSVVEDVKIATRSSGVDPFLDESNRCLLGSGEIGSFGIVVVEIEGNESRLSAYRRRRCIGPRLRLSLSLGNSSARFDSEEADRPFLAFVVQMEVSLLQAGYRVAVAVANYYGNFYQVRLDGQGFRGGRDVRCAGGTDFVGGNRGLSR